MSPSTSSAGNLIAQLVLEVGQLEEDGDERKAVAVGGEVLEVGQLEEERDERKTVAVGGEGAPSTQCGEGDGDVLIACADVAIATEGANLLWHSLPSAFASCKIYARQLLP